MNNAKMAQYFSDDKYNLYRTRVIICCVFLASILAIGIFLGFNIVRKIEVTPISYSEKCPTDYKVYLIENKFYTEDFLPKGTAYPTGLIDYIDINNNYQFDINAAANIDFDYEIVADLIIQNNTTKKELLKKPYNILESQKKRLNGSDQLIINERLQINYSLYNQFANEYRSTLGLDTYSYLKVYMKVKRNTVDMDYSLKDSEVNMGEVFIPLSERSIEINIDVASANPNINYVTFDKTSEVNYVSIGLLLVLAVVGFYSSKILYVSYKKMSRRRSLYDKYVSRLLKEYDRLIVETKTMIDFRKYNMIKVSEFTELLDVRDNLKLPINYYCMVKHVKGIFYIKSDNDIYTFYISTNVLEREKNTNS